MISCVETWDHNKPFCFMCHITFCAWMRMLLKHVVNYLFILKCLSFLAIKSNAIGHVYVQFMPNFIITWFVFKAQNWSAPLFFHYLSRISNNSGMHNSSCLWLVRLWNCPCFHILVCNFKIFLILLYVFQCLW